MLLKANDLTPKQEKFCLEYLKTGNATKSYLKAGYVAKTDQIAWAEASKLIRKPKVKAYLEKHLETQREQGLMDFNDIYKRLSMIASGKAKTTVVASNGTVREIPVKTSDQISAMKEMLKRFPKDTDPEKYARIAKTNAETEYIKAKTEAIQLLKGSEVTKVDELLDAMKDGIV